MKQRITACAMLLAAALAAQAQTVVENFVPGSTLEGISYFLPPPCALP